jgi:hypothetical protein
VEPIIGHWIATFSALVVIVTEVERASGTEQREQGGKENWKEILRISDAHVTCSYKDSSACQNQRNRQERAHQHGLAPLEQMPLSSEVVKLLAFSLAQAAGFRC